MQSLLTSIITKTDCNMKKNKLHGGVNLVEVFTKPTVHMVALIFQKKQLKLCMKILMKK